MKQNSISKSLIAPCGMNCAICKAFLRQHNPCHGCKNAEQNMPKTRLNCKMRLCDKRTGNYCYQCTEFPCDRLRHMDHRYRTRYGMSEIENLEFIRDNGIRKFLAREQEKYISEKGILCVHDKKHYGSGAD